MYNTSFYYNKNNLIEYYIHSIENNNLRVTALYDYVKNSYDIILSYFSYNPNKYYSACIVKTPNGQLYLIEHEEIIITNTSKNTLLYNYRDYFTNDVTRLFHSMPIANSFILVVISTGEEIVIHVIDLIKEKKYAQTYPLKKILETMLNLLEGNDRYYKEIEYIISLYESSINELSFHPEATNSIDNSINSLIFYDSCIVNISLSFENTSTGDKNTINEFLSIIARYQSGELTVRLQINSNIKVEAPSYTYL